MVILHKGSSTRTKQNKTNSVLPDFLIAKNLAVKIEIKYFCDTKFLATEYQKIQRRGKSKD